jgi:hypothetical protein
VRKAGGVSHAASISLPAPSADKTLLEEMMEEAVRANKEKEVIRRKEAAEASKGFGTGLSGGFFASSKPVAPVGPVATPKSTRCDNPDCRKLETDVVAAGGKFMKCSRCKAVWYCSADCQKAHWRLHKSHCGKVTGVS